MVIGFASTRLIICLLFVLPRWRSYGAILRVVDTTDLRQSEIEFKVGSTSIMGEYFQQIFCPDDPEFSLVLEDDGKVAYAYLLKNKKIIADVWLYNQGDPKKEDYSNPQNLPFLNPSRFINDTPLSSLNNAMEEDINVSWELRKNGLTVKVEIFKTLTIVLKEGVEVGWSNMVNKDGPFAKKLRQDKLV